MAGKQSARRAAMKAFYSATSSGCCSWSEDDDVGDAEMHRRVRQSLRPLFLFLFVCGVTEPEEKRLRLLAVGCQLVASVAATAPLPYSHLRQRMRIHKIDPSEIA
jgi:hypothetical protein